MVLNKCSCRPSSAMMHYAILAMKPQYQYKLCRLRPTHPPKSHLSTTSKFKRRRGATDKRKSKSEKRIAHVKKSMKQRLTKQKKEERLETIRDNVALVREKVIPKSIQQSPLVQAISSQKLQSQVMDKVASFQNQVQRALLPESIRHVNRPSEKERMLNSVVMDRKWWIWNLAMACIPGVLVACICEYHQTEMKNYYKRMNKNLGKQKNCSGVENTTDAGDSTSTSAGADTSIFKTLAGDDNKGMTEIFSDALKDIFGINLGAIANSHDDTIQESTTYSQSTSTNTAKTNTATTKMNQENHLDDKMKGTMETQQQEQVIEELLSRIKVLEEKLDVEVPITTTSSTSKLTQTTDENNNYENYDNTPRSNIRKRIEARKKKSMKEEEEEEKHQKNSMATTFNQLKDNICGLLLPSLPPSLLGGDSNTDNSDVNDCGDNDINLSETESSQNTLNNNVAHEDDESDEVIPKLIVDQQNDNINTNTSENNMIDDQKEDSTNHSSTIGNELKDQKQIKSNMVWKWVRNRFSKEG